MSKTHTYFHCLQLTTEVRTKNILRAWKAGGIKGDTNHCAPRVSQCHPTSFQCYPVSFQFSSFNRHASIPTENHQDITGNLSLRVLAKNLSQRPFYNMQMNAWVNFQQEFVCVINSENVLLIQRMHNQKKKKQAQFCFCKLSSWRKAKATFGCFPHSFLVSYLIQ